MHKAKWLAAAAVAMLTMAGAQAQPQLLYAWAPKPDPMTLWKAPNKPIWRLADILKAHQGQASWVQPIVRDQDYSADYIQMAPGTRTRTQFWADDRIFFMVWGGQIRFTIQGQQPFVASKGFMVQIPYRTPYSMEVVGDEPALRFEVIRPNRTPLYTVADGDSAPVAKGKTYQKVSYATPAQPYGDAKVYIDFMKDYVNNPAQPKGNIAFVKDDTNFMNIIRGQGVPTPPDSNKGHFHTDYNEFWFIAEGRIDYKMEGMRVFSAAPGDIVYAPQGRWHRASFGGDTMDTRIAINPRPAGLHNYDFDAGAKQ